MILLPNEVLNFNALSIVGWSLFKTLDVINTLS